MTPLRVVMFVAAPAVVALLVFAALEVAGVFRQWRAPKVSREEWLPMWDPRRHRP